jgi:hypothetical protein
LGSAAPLANGERAIVAAAMKVPVVFRKFRRSIVFPVQIVAGELSNIRLLPVNAYMKTRFKSSN